MIIRKQFKFEGAHIVRDCSSDRCKKSIHGHSYIVEVFLTSEGIDNGGMVMDFGLTKGPIADFIDSFDHAYSLWSAEKSDFSEFMNSHSDRVVQMPVTPSAEMYSLMFYFVIDKIIQSTEFNNGEKKVSLHSIRVHETATGYAESFRSDLVYWEWDFHDIVFSPAIQLEWKDPMWWQNLRKEVKFTNPKIKLEYE